MNRIRILALLAIGVISSLHAQTLPTVLNFGPDVTANYGGSTLFGNNSGTVQNPTNVVFTMQDTSDVIQFWTDNTYTLGNLDLSGYTGLTLDADLISQNGQMNGMQVNLYGSDFTTLLESWVLTNADLGLTGGFDLTFANAGLLTGVGVIEFRINSLLATPDSASGNVQFNSLTATIPEPSTLALLGLGAAALYILRRKQK